MTPGPKPRPLLDRLADKMLVGDGCWEWTGATQPNGYGYFHVGSLTDGSDRMEYAHRVVYEALVGPIPEGLTLDHQCHNESACEGGPLCPHRRCVRPAHLEPASDEENKRRGRHTNGNARKTHCQRGHPFTPENTSVTTTGARRCRPCAKEYQREYRRDRQAMLRRHGFDEPEPEGPE